MVERLTKDLGAKQIAILYQDDAFGRAGLAGVQQALDKPQMQLVAEGTFERNTVAVKRALLDISRGKPDAVIMVGAYKPCAEFIKLATQIKLDADLRQHLLRRQRRARQGARAGRRRRRGDAGRAVPERPGDPGRCDATRRRSRPRDPAAEPGFVSLEGYLVGRAIVAALEKVDGEPTRKALLEAIVEGPEPRSRRLQARPTAPTDNRGMAEVFLTALGPMRFKRSRRSPRWRLTHRKPSIFGSGSMIESASPSNPAQAIRQEACQAPECRRARHPHEVVCLRWRRCHASAAVSALVS